MKLLALCALLVLAAVARATALRADAKAPLRPELLVRGVERLKAWEKGAHSGAVSSLQATQASCERRIAAKVEDEERQRTELRRAAEARDAQLALVNATRVRLRKANAALLSLEDDVAAQEKRLHELHSAAEEEQRSLTASLAAQNSTLAAVTSAVALIRNFESVPAASAVLQSRDEAVHDGQLASARDIGRLAKEDSEQAADGSDASAPAPALLQLRLRAMLRAPRAADCYTVEDGLDYTGQQNRTRSGLACQRWDSLRPHFQPYGPDGRQFVPAIMGDGQHNFCRNPVGAPTRTAPWCYTTSPEVKWQYCDVPSCPDVVDMVTGLRSVLATALTRLHGHKARMHDAHAQRLQLEKDRLAAAQRQLHAQQEEVARLRSELDGHGPILVPLEAAVTERHAALEAVGHELTLLKTRCRHEHASGVKQLAERVATLKELRTIASYLNSQEFQDARAAAEQQMARVEEREAEQMADEGE